MGNMTGNGRALDSAEGMTLPDPRVRGLRLADLADYLTERYKL